MTATAHDPSGVGGACGVAGDSATVVGDPAANAAKMMMEKGHKRSQSKTEFILPPGHEERERRRRESNAQVRTYKCLKHDVNIVMI